MATRFYLPADGTIAPVVSPAFDSSWESSASAFRAIMDTTKTGTALATKSIATSLNSPAGAVDIAFAQYISAPLNGDQTISGAIKGIIRATENNTSADLRAQMVIRVVSNDGSTVRGTLIASDGSALTSEWVFTTLTNRKFPLAWTGSGQTPSSVNALDGDRIVIEIGYRKHENATTSRTGSLSLGDPAGSTDCAEDESTTTANCPWVEFADTLSFDSGQARITQVAPEVVVLPTSQQARITQVAPEVVVLPTSQQARITQVALDVVYPKPPPTGSFTLDAFIRRTQDAAFTVEAVVRGTQTNSFSLDAFITKTNTSAFTADAVLGLVQPGDFALDAIIAKTLPSNFTLDAVLRRSKAGTFTLDAVIYGTRFDLYAVVLAHMGATLTLDAEVLPRHFRVDAIVGTLQPSYVDLTVDATVLSEQIGFWYGAFNYLAFLTATPVPAAMLELTISYQVAPSAGADLAINHRIVSASVSLDCELDAGILEAVGISVVLDWGVSSAVAYADLTFPYAIDSIYVASIFYDGTDITEDVLAHGCEFTTRAGGFAGTASLLVKRPAGAFHGYETGRTLDLRIGYDWVWRGWVTSVTSEYPFDYDDTRGLVPRSQYIRLEGTDINDLFNKRIVFNQSDPKLKGPVYSAFRTPDTTALHDLFDHWLDLSGDGLTINFTTNPTEVGIHNVGYLNIDQDAYPIGPSSKWGETMAAIAAMPGAVYYIDPDKRVVYTDVDTADAPHDLSDTPGVDENSVGYRQMTLTLDAGQLTNDYFGWGRSGASSGTIFQRLADAASASLHGVWQAATVNSSVYKPATLDHIVRTYVYGSPTNHRGHKDDQPIIRVTVRDHGFRAAQKVRFISHTHGYDDVVPIRVLTVRFPDGLKVPLYELTLSHEIDMMTFMDVLWPGGKDYTVLEPPHEEDEDPELLHEIVIDSFSRVLAENKSAGQTPGWQTGEEVTWTMHLNTPHAGVDGNNGYLMAMWPEAHWQLYENPWNGASTTVPEVSHNPAGGHVGEPISMQNIVIEFSLRRYIRAFPVTVVTTEPAADQDGNPINWVTPEKAVDMFQGVVGNDGRFQVLAPDPLGTWAGLGAHVSSVSDSYSISFMCQAPPDSYVDRVIVKGPYPLPGIDSDGSIGGGLVPWYHTYANATSTIWGTGDVLTLSWNLGAPGLFYVPGARIAEVIMAGPDSSSCLFNQKVSMQINVAGWTMNVGSLNQNQAGLPDGLTPDGLSNQAYAFETQPGSGTPVSHQGGTKVIEPGWPYKMRIHNPNAKTQMVKVWGGWDGAGEEPTEWTTWSLLPGWDDPDAPAAGRGISFNVDFFPYQTYGLNVDRIVSVPGDYGWDDLLPTSATGPAPNTFFGEATFVSDGVTTVFHTRWPYIPGSLTIWCNGTIQRNGVDFTETDPATGTYTLNFTPDVGDKLTLRYYTQ